MCPRSTLREAPNRHVSLAQGHSQVMGAPVTLALVSVVLVTGCTETPTEPTPASPTETVSPSMEATPSAVRVADVDSFLKALDAAGFDVREGRVVDGLGFPVWPPGREVCINGVRVTAYEFATDAEAGDVRSAITQDGYGIPTGGEALAHVDWIGRPHFFAGGRLIVLYIGSDKEGTLDALELVLGQQFAGSDEGGRSTELGLGPDQDPCNGP